MAEHIPARYEANFVTNLALATSRGLVVAWGQVTGTHHTNPKDLLRTLKLLGAHGFCFDANATVRLRHCAAFPYHRQDLLVVKRRGAWRDAMTTYFGFGAVSRGTCNGVPNEKIYRYIDR